MKKSVKKDLKQALRPFKDIKFNRSLVVILFAILILILSFTIYTHYNLGIPLKEYEETFIEPSGTECLTNFDCPQPRCPGMEGLCENGYCIVRQTGPTTTKCIDLKMPICGNNICEADEKDKCPEDCI